MDTWSFKDKISMAVAVVQREKEERGEKTEQKKK